jgi:hypothetical protein
MKVYSLNTDDIIEVIRIKGDEVIKKEMKLSDWIKLKKQIGYRYIAYQKGFSKYKLE